MGFADAYLMKQGRNSLIGEPPSKELRCIAVIPAYKEEQLHRTLFSLAEQLPVDGTAEVIILVNVPEKADSRLVHASELLVTDCRRQFGNPEGWLRFHMLPLQILPQKDAGVGLARKIGMDEAASRFNSLERPEGIILSCDADAVYESNLFRKTVHHFEANPETHACSISFKHEYGPEYSPEINTAIIKYELYLRYYLLGLRYAGHPHAYQTIGSSFAVRSDVYCRQGGMNKRKAGEDFYFLQKIIQSGQFSELKSTIIRLSPRSSDRVPFGTGAAVAKLLSSASGDWMTYHPAAFQQLRDFIAYIQATDDVKADIAETPGIVAEPLSGFLRESGCRDAILEIKENTGSREAFIKRFFNWFNAFRVLRYMNYSHEKHFVKTEIDSCVRQMLGICGIDNMALPDTNEELLLYMRTLEEQTGYSNLTGKRY